MQVMKMKVRDGLWAQIRVHIYTHKALKKNKQVRKETKKIHIFKSIFLGVLSVLLYR